MGRFVLAMTAGFGVLVALGCGGAWDEAMGQAIQEQVAQMRGRVAGVEDGPGKDAVLDALDGLHTAAGAQRVGLMELAEFQVELDEALTDGRIDEAEAAAITAQAETIAAE